MKILSPKNKSMLKMAAMWFGILVIIAIIFRAFKSGVQGAGEIAKVAVADLKSVISFNSVVLFMLTLAGIVGLWFDAQAGISYAVALGTLVTANGVVTTFNSTYVPKTFQYTAATQLTGVKITVQGDGVIFDSDANGLNHAGVNRLAGQVTNKYTFRIANGFISGKNVIWEFTNSAAQTPVVYVDSDETQAKGRDMYIQLLRQAVLASSGQNFEDFATISLPSLGATDVVNVLYRDGTQQQMNRDDIQAKLQYTQNIVNTPIYMLDNWAGRIKTVNIIAGAAQTAYIQRYVPLIGGGMVNQQVNF